MCVAVYTIDMTNTANQTKTTFSVLAHNDFTGLFETIGTVEAKTPKGANQIAWRKWGYDKWSQFTVFDQNGKGYEFGSSYNNY